MKKKLLSTALSVAMAAVMLTGCGDGQSASASGNGSSMYRVLYSSEVSTLNYLTTATTNEYQIGANVIDTLVEYDNFANLQPGLATEWSYDEASMTWTFTCARDRSGWIIPARRLPM